MIIVTGGAGFIGSALIWQLNQAGRRDIILVDDVDHPEKQHNIDPLQYTELVAIADFRERLLAGSYDTADLSTIVHLGAISATTETSWPRLLDINVNYTKTIIEWCVKQGVRCIYASSGATYGKGEAGYSDDEALFDKLQPLNLYGKSKLMVDLWARDQGFLNSVVGLRYFNVFGPNENHKEEMRSPIAKKITRAKNEGIIELFKSYGSDYADGESKRDFIYVKDAVAATLFFIEHPTLGGVYNVGTGQARTWNDVAQAMFAALEKPGTIRYIDMPAELRNQYQYFTEADITKLRQAGFATPMTSLEDAITEYVQKYLLPHEHLSSHSALR